MIDELFDRNYQAGRADLNGGIDRALATVSNSLRDSLRVLHRIEWSAPWQAPKKPIGRG